MKILIFDAVLIRFIHTNTAPAARSKRTPVLYFECVAIFATSRTVHINNGEGKTEKHTGWCNAIVV